MDTEQVTATGANQMASGDQTDQRAELMEFLKSQLIECGWRDQVANSCRSLIQKYGVEQVKLSQIVSEVRTEARRNVPESVRSEVLNRIRRMQQQ